MAAWRRGARSHSVVEGPFRTISVPSLGGSVSQAIAIRRLLLCFIFQASCGPAPDPPRTYTATAAAGLAQGRRLAADGIKAYRAGDFTTFAAKTDSAVSFRPAHPGLVYNLAAARALMGDADGATRLLERLAGWGLSYDPGEDADFGELAGDPDFQAAREHLLANGETRGRASQTVRLEDPELLPEGLAYDEQSGSFVLASVRRRSVLRVSPDGTASVLVDGMADGMPPPLGMAIDPGSRALWVSGTEVPEALPLPGGGAAPGPQVREYDLDTGALRRSLVPPALSDAASRDAASADIAVGDLAVGPDGWLLVSDWRSGAVLRARPGSDTLEIVLHPGRLGSPQGIVPTRDGRGAWIADYALGLVFVDFARGSVDVARGETTFVGTDGLLADGDDLLLVQNGVSPARVLRVEMPRASGGRRDEFRVDDVEVLLAAHPDFSEPTGMALVDGVPHVVANGQWSHFAGGEVRDREGLRPPIILRIE